MQYRTVKSVEKDGVYEYVLFILEKSCFGGDVRKALLTTPFSPNSTVNCA